MSEQPLIDPIEDPKPPKPADTETNPPPIPPTIREGEDPDGPGIPDGMG